MSAIPAVDIRSISHRYGDRQALNEVSFTVRHPEIFALLGPNGGGKTTLFKILSTQMQPSAGTARIMGYDVQTQPNLVRAHLGVVFQAPSIDKKLTAEENLYHQGHLYGLSGKDLRARVDRAIGAVGLGRRLRDRVEKLSGGMQRRVEIAKSLLHDPSVLLLDEPSTGLDPTARLEVWNYLTEARDERQITSLLTTHLMEEADKADRVAIIHQGQLVACGTPAELKAAIGGEVLELTTEFPQQLAEQIRTQFGLNAQTVDAETVRLETPPAADVSGARLLIKIVETFPGLIRSSRVGMPTLEDVFIHCTGIRYSISAEEVQAA